MVVSRCLGIGPPSGIPPLGRCLCSLRARRAALRTAHAQRLGIIAMGDPRYNIQIV